VYLATTGSLMGATGLTFYDDGTVHFFGAHSGNKSAIPDRTGPPAKPALSQ